MTSTALVSIKEVFSEDIAIKVEVQSISDSVGVKQSPERD
jgi:hypothetical protein